MSKTEINDKRTSKEFSKITFSKYSKHAAKKALVEAILNNKIEPACYWSAEFICAGHLSDIWEIIIQFVSLHIHLGNPKLPIYIILRFEIFKTILINGYIGNEISLRNNEKIRKLFCELITVLCLSRKKQAIQLVKVKKEEFDIINLQSHLNAKNITFAQVVFRRGDPKELFIAINELSYHLSPHSNNSRSACFWIEWIIEFSNICAKEKKQCIAERREEIPVQSKYQKDCIWIIWELLLYYSKCKHTLCTKIIESLLKLFCIRYSSGMKKRRRCLIYNAIFIITEFVDYKIKILDNQLIVKNTTKKIDIIYSQIKKNELTPNTQYLFNNTINKGTNLDNTLKKIDKLNSLTNIIPRK